MPPGGTFKDPPRNLRQEAACLLSIVLRSGSHLHVGTSASHPALEVPFLQWTKLQSLKSFPPPCGPSSVVNILVKWENKWDRNEIKKF